MVRRLCADDVCRLEAFRALQQVKLHGLTLVERAVAVLLDCGEVHEHIFPRGALDESIPFRPVEPLYCTFLSHGKNSFHQSLRIVLQLSRSSPRSIEAPLKEAGRTLCVHSVRKEVLPKMKKTPQFLAAECIRSVNFRSPTIWRVSTTPNNRYPALTGLTTGPFPGIAK